MSVDSAHNIEVVNVGQHACDLCQSAAEIIYWPIYKHTRLTKSACTYSQSQIVHAFYITQRHHVDLVVRSITLIACYWPTFLKLILCNCIVNDIKTTSNYI